MTARQVIVRSTGGGKFQQWVSTGPHVLPADEPSDMGGNDTGPSPYEYLMAALGCCTSMTLRMYADHKGLPLEGVDVLLSHEKKDGKDVFHREITIHGKDLGAEQRARLIEIANKCPVHKTLSASSAIETAEKI